MRKVPGLIIMLFIFSLARVKAQVIPGTEKVTVSELYADSVQQYLQEYGKGSSYYLSSLIPENANRLSAIAVFNKGDFIPAQGATRSVLGGLDTEGSLSVGSTRLYGSFGYLKVFEDSTRFAHQTRNNTTSPFYFGSPGYVHYERSIYSLRSMAGRDFFQKRFNVAAGIDYRVGDHFSSNDPRGSVTEYQLDITASAAYRVTRKIKLGLAWRPGYGQEKVSVAYKNPRYYESITFPVYYNHLINGYGEGVPALTGSKRRYTDDQKRGGGDFYADYTGPGGNSFFLQAGILSEAQRYYFNSDVGFEEKAKYNLKTTRLNFIWQKTGVNRSLVAHLAFSERQGKDFNLNYQANNYIYSGRDLNFNILLKRSRKKTILNYQFSPALSEEERVDGIKGNDLFTRNFLLKVGAGIDQRDKKRGSVGLNLKGAFNTPLSSTFMVGKASESYFTQYVIFHDYLFKTSSYAGGELSFKYERPLSKQMFGAILIDMNYQHKVSSKALDRTIVSRPGKNHFNSSISFNVYF